MKLIDADVLLNEVFERHCKNCDKRKGIKNGAYRIIYEIGEAPCRACEIADMTDYLEEAPTVDAVDVIKCKDCKHHDDECLWCKKLQRETENDCYCSLAKRRNCND